MSARSFARVRWQRRALATLFGLVLLTPAFGWASEQMDNAAELAGAASQAEPTALSLFSGYAIPGLGPHLGTLGAALVGTALTLALALGLAQLLRTTGK